MRMVDPQTFERTVRKYQRMLVGYLWRRLGYDEGLTLETFDDVICVLAGGSLTLTNSVPETGSITCGDVWVDGGTFTMNGGVIAGCDYAGVFVSYAGSVFIMNGGAITNNGIINATKRKLTVVGNVQNANEDDTAEARDNSVITAREFEYMGPLYPTCAYSNEVIHLYWAKGLSFGDRHLDEDESINVEMMDLKDVVKMILEGKIQDAKTQAAVLQVWTRMNQSVRF